jgi:aryl-alcohol dehydrogenase-like predicted oxidoreductase
VITRAFGRSGLEVSALGLGTGWLGAETVPDAVVREVFAAAIDLGITLFDTARSYGVAEERMGRFLADRRAGLVYSTKLGYGVDGVPDWTGPCVTAGVDAALGRLRTDWIDVVHLHSCPREVLERGEVVAALVRAVEAGKVRVAAYSGENEALSWAVGAEGIGAVQTSVNLCDQWSLRYALGDAGARGLGVIAKRPLANAFWRFAERPTGDYAELYWARWEAMGLHDVDPASIALRYAAFAPGVHCAIVGTTRVEHLRAAAARVEEGPLGQDVIARVEAAFDPAWPGDV